MDRLKILHQLLQLQDYEIVVQEIKIVYPKSGKENKFNQCIDEMRQKIDKKILKIYDKKGVSREINGCCNNCYITISIGDLIRMNKNEEKIPRCPSCFHFLYLENFVKK